MACQPQALHNSLENHEGAPHLPASVTRGCGAQKLDRDKTADESHLLLQIIVSQIPAITIRVEPTVEMDLVEIRGNDLLAQFMRLRAHKRHVPAS